MYPLHIEAPQLSDCSRLEDLSRKRIRRLKGVLLRNDPVYAIWFVLLLP